MPLVGIGTPPHPPTRRLVCPLPPVSGGGEHSLARKGLGESHFRQGAYTVVLFICTYFVVGGIGEGERGEGSGRGIGEGGGRGGQAPRPP
jgi:hypothetical protein